MTLTKHGHHIPGTGESRNERALADPQNCGGTDSCPDCKDDTARVHAKLEELGVPLEEEY
jgi:hypothetical protein